MSIDYAREKLWQALGSLVGAASIQDRLAYAANFLIRLEPDDFPENMRDEFAAVMHTLTK